MFVQLTLKGYDSATSRTDHLIKWVSAPTWKALEKFLNRQLPNQVSIFSLLQEFPRQLMGPVGNEDMDIVLDEDGGESRPAVKWAEEVRIAKLPNAL